MKLSGRQNCDRYTVWKNEKFSLFSSNQLFCNFFFLWNHCFHEIFAKKVWERISAISTLCKYAQCAVQTVDNLDSLFFDKNSVKSTFLHCIFRVNWFHDIFSFLHTTQSMLLCSKLDFILIPSFFALISRKFSSYCRCHSDWPFGSSPINFPWIFGFEP